jgi:hypothetical protein
MLLEKQLDARAAAEQGKYSARMQEIDGQRTRAREKLEADIAKRPDASAAQVQHARLALESQATTKEQTALARYEEIIKEMRAQKTKLLEDHLRTASALARAITKANTRAREAAEAAGEAPADPAEEKRRKKELKRAASMSGMRLSASNTSMSSQELSPENSDEDGSSLKKSKKQKKREAEAALRTSPTAPTTLQRLSPSAGVTSPPPARSRAGK